VRIDIANPEAKTGSTPGLRSPIVMDGRALAAERPAPVLGQHGEDVLNDPAWTGE
jgi:crotonobetainyl-CoA:carnitine CoA-transferase CaiB-like acyl-CoA transferase